MVVGAVACAATTGRDKSPAVGSRGCLPAPHCLHRYLLCLTMQVVTGIKCSNLQTLAHENTRMHPSIPEEQQATAVAVTGAKAAILKDADFNDSAWRLGQAHSLCARNNEAVIPPVAMTIQNDGTVNTDQD
ncbi:hypothetical protein CesoFtcFv8_024040 [Champsocephalus esox]|uniref:Uncharacterized protein n=1 Tax=Champsocephalus esox TaxID=159716 RepID=A0AAN8B4Z0_9TELE|nr:hypothetical protein CesoFtcFv8_024040 [Champsocephalus esox]